MIPRCSNSSATSCAASVSRFCALLMMRCYVTTRRSTTITRKAFSRTQGRSSCFSWNPEWSLFHFRQRLPCFHSSPFFHVDLFHHSRLRGLQLILHFHGFNHYNALPGFHLGACGRQNA